MLQRKNLVLVVSITLPLSLVSGTMPAAAQNHPGSPAPSDDARAETRPEASAPSPARVRARIRRATVPPTPHNEEPVATASAAPDAAAESEPPPPLSAERHDPPAADPSTVPPIHEEPPLLDLASAATRAAPPPAPSDAMRELDDVLSGEPGDPLATLRQAARPVPSVERPSREETTAAIERVIPRVRACVADDVSGVVVLRIVFISNGRATTVEIQSHSAPLSQAQRGCIARAARHAQVSAFQRSRFTTSFPIRL